MNQSTLGAAYLNNTVGPVCKKGELDLALMAVIKVRDVLQETHTQTAHIADRMFGAEPEESGESGDVLARIGEIGNLHHELAQLFASAQAVQNQVMRLNRL